MRRFRVRFSGGAPSFGVDDMVNARRMCKVILTLLALLMYKCEELKFAEIRIGLKTAALNMLAGGDQLWDIHEHLCDVETPC